MPERAPGAELSIAILSDTAVAGAAGSITALTSALACEFAGFKDVTLYHDSSDVLADHSIELSPNASRVLRALKVLDNTLAHSFEPQFIHQRSYRTGFQLAITALGAMAEGRYNAPFLHVQSSALTDVLTAAAKARGIKLSSGNPLQGLQQINTPLTAPNRSDNTHATTIELSFSASANASANSAEPNPSERATHDVVLVADDPQQTVRRLSNAEALRQTKTSLTHWRGSTPYEELPPGAFAAVLTQWVGPTQHMSYHFTASGELLEFNALVHHPSESEGESGTHTKQDLQNAFADWHPSLSALIESATSLDQTPIISTESVERLVHGSVAFLGSSCHSLMPHLPQQQALGIEDAWVISRMLEQWEDQPADGLLEYERYRLPRARRMTANAAARASQLCDTRPFETWRRNMGMTFGSRFLPELAMQKNDWLYGYDAVNGFE